ncbi:hypothetical protein [Planococcus chinensis]|uniref:Uncharacterized protein n=1 Tax=Planococcus chinensis TaxID=272917 RepID=A0ABW4QME9_9BACL
MGIGRIVKTAIKFAPIAYPIIKKVMNKQKAGTTSTRRTPKPKR